MAGTCGNDDHVAVTQDFEVVSAGELRFMGEHRPVGDIEGFSVCSFAVNVVKDDFICRAT